MIKGVIKMKRLTNKEAQQLITITDAEQLPKAACYYSQTATQFGRYGESYFRLFDKNYKEIACVNVRYTNALAKLTNVADENDNIGFHSAQLVYHLSDRNELGFWVCNSISDSVSQNTETPLRRLLKYYDLSQTEMAKEFDIPLRTVQNWCTGARECPSYLLKLIRYKLENKKRGL